MCSTEGNIDEQKEIKRDLQVNINPKDGNISSEMKSPLGEIKQSETEKGRLLKMTKVAIKIEFQ